MSRPVGVGWEAWKWVKKRAMFVLSKCMLGSWPDGGHTLQGMVAEVSE